MLTIALADVSQSLFAVDLTGVGVSLFLLSLALTFLAMGAWYILVVAVALAVMWYTKNLAASIMAMLLLAGGIAWVRVSNWPDTWTLTVIATFTALLALCVLFILREQTEVFD